MTSIIHANTLWISDIRLGNRDCNAELLLNFLNKVDCKTLYLVGDKGYELLLTLNRWYNSVQQMRKRSYWSLAGYIKERIKGANLAIARYRKATCQRAAQLGLDGVICGHIHHPESQMVNGIHYVNDGDWVENCSAVYEDQFGELQLLNWTELQTSVTELKMPESSTSKAA